MQKHNTLIVWLGVLVVIVIFLINYSSGNAMPSYDPARPAKETLELKGQALEILDTKCNICHRKQNPMMIFKEKNMKKRATKIYNMVFVERRMPKGDIRLTSAEYATLKKWLSTKNID